VNDITALVGSPSSPVAPMSNAFAQALKEKYGQVVLVLQGGGALGAYQVGVYQALHEIRVEPDWIIGTSIGAINESPIAGNEPRNRIDPPEEFWRRMRRQEFWRFAARPGLSDTTAYWSTLLGGIPGFFEPNPCAFMAAHYPLGKDTAGFYSTPLQRALAELVDFTLIERSTPRPTVGTAQVRMDFLRASRFENDNRRRSRVGEAVHRYASEEESRAGQE
jgi:NTE family protein